jgi:Ca2+-binding EF-hand superfamily protein
MRSKLSKASFIKWLRTRYHNENRKNNSYLYFPLELVKEMSIEQIFREFDADGSGGLSRGEVFDMFNDYGIPISMDNLNMLYDSVEVNLEEMDCDMFKRCALS